jgi:hypothetical protein
MSRTKRVQPEYESRLRRRFPLSQEVRYRRLKGGKVSAWAIGKSLDISSSEIRFLTEYAFKPGEKVEVNVDWPVRLQDTCLMKLVIHGKVVESDAHITTVKIVRYDFHTRAANPIPVEQPVATLSRRMAAGAV